MTAPLASDRSPASELPPPADVLLADGGVAVIRPLRPDDRAALEGLHERASDDSVRLRFFALSRRAGHDYVAHLFSEHGPAACLVATVRGDVVGIASAERLSEDTAEVAFMVADAARGRGVGSLLLEHLAAAARDLGIRSFTAEVLSDNLAMSQVFADAGFSMTRRANGGVVDVELSTTASARAVAAADAREFRSEALSLAPLMRPACVAVVGVRREPGGIGRAVLDSIRAGGFTGELAVVHPSAPEIDGIPTHRRLTDVGRHIDVVVVTVPVSRLLAVMDDAVAAAVSTMVVISSGFEEVGAEGADIQHRMLRLARENSIRLIGPNCLGVMVNDPAIRLNATFTRLVPPPGGLAVASQSGGVGIVLLDVAARIGLGVGSFISLGNKADVSGNDLLAAWSEDPRVTAGALYLESFGNAPKFARIARTFSERKPLLAVVGGRSAGGRRAGASHTAAAATPAVGVDALFAQTGVIACHSAEAMAETALLLSEQPRPAGFRIGVISNAGGMGVLASDSADAHGLTVPELSAALRARVAEHVTGTSGTSNPIDLGAGAGPPGLAAAVDAVLASGEVDALVVVLVATSVADPTPLLGALAAARTPHRDVPVVLVPMGGLEVAPGALAGVTTLPSVEAAVSALARVSRYSAWLRTPHDETAAHDETRAAAARARARVLVAADAGEGWLGLDDAVELLAPYGLAPDGRLALSAVDAAVIAAALGFPVAVKVADPGVVHKTDRGLVRTGLGSVPEVLAAVRDFATELHAESVPVLVQPMVDGVEVALGIVRDPGFGPLVMVAAGGVATDVWDDRSFLIPPIGARDAARAVRSLRLWPVLNGYRGARSVDVAALERELVALGRLAADVPEVAELDLNPVLVTATGIARVDVKIRLCASAPIQPGIPRQLRTTP